MSLKWIALLTFALAGGSVFADMRTDLMSACKSDLNKYCSNITPGEGREMACLKANEDKLSGDCSSKWTQAKAQVKQNITAARAACKDDVQKFCSDAAGPSEISSCLQKHSSDLSSSCRDWQSKHASMAGKSGMTNRNESG